MCKRRRWWRGGCIELRHLQWSSRRRWRGGLAQRSPRRGHLGSSSHSPWCLAWVLWRVCAPPAHDATEREGASRSWRRKCFFSAGMRWVTQAPPCADVHPQLMNSNEISTDTVFRADGASRAIAPPCLRSSRSSRPAGRRRWRRRRGRCPSSWAHTAPSRRRSRAGSAASRRPAAPPRCPSPPWPPASAHHRATDHTPSAHNKVATGSARRSDATELCSCSSDGARGRWTPTAPHRL
jgi:hypothetical protein